MDKPWESYGVGPAGYNTCDFHTVIYDEDVYRGWYNSLSRERIGNAQLQDPNYSGYICYAESENGFYWLKPELDSVQRSSSSPQKDILEKDP